MLAYDYPMLGVLLSMFWFFIWVIWLVLLFRIFGDIFRSEDLGGGGKALWCIFVVLVPFLGVFVYLIARGKEMGERDVARAADAEAQFRTYVQQTAGTSGGIAQQLEQLAALKESGVLTEDEFAREKAKLLAEQAASAAERGPP